MSEQAWRAAYDALGVPLMWAGVRAAALFDGKARELLRGRRAWRDSASCQLAEAARHDGDRAGLPTVWLHATSVGEFEQARPLLAALHSTHRLVMTRFSPSVAPAMDRCAQLDASVYLPLDSRRNVAQLLDLIRPSALIFSKFDIWPNCVWEAAKRGIPCALIAGTMHGRSRRLRPVIRGLLRHVHSHLALQCAVSEEDAQRLRQMSPPDANVVVTGDTRFDQVFARAEQTAVDVPDCLRDWTGLRVVAGSTYEQDEAVLIPAFARLRAAVPDARLILVPHEPTEDRIRACEAALDHAGVRSTRYSNLSPGTEGPRSDVGDVGAVVVDRVGVLAALYGLASAAFVGGSFRSRVHNVMEPAVFSKPVLFGPLIDNSGEANGLLQCGGAWRVHDEGELSAALLRLAREPGHAGEMGQAGRDYIVANLGASTRTLEALRRWVL